MTEQKYRWRLTFAKKEQVKYIGHLDLMLAWERALRRAKIPLAYSQGFNPRPKMQAASSLPLGTTGTAEILDITVTESLDLLEATERIRRTLPVGIALHSIEEVPLKNSTLQQLVRQANYRVMVETDLSPELLRERIEVLLTANEIWRIRKRRKQQEKFNLRPLLHELDIELVTDKDFVLHIRASAGQFGNLRPQDVLSELDLDDCWFTIERTKLIF
jgi:radical SAM-linked protein